MASGICSTSISLKMTFLPSALPWKNCTSQRKAKTGLLERTSQQCLWRKSRNLHTTTQTTLAGLLIQSSFSLLQQHKQLISFIPPAGTVYVDFSMFVGVMLLKVPWFTPGFSYCRWWGVECCLTASEASLPSCTQGLQSIGALALAGQSHWASHQAWPFSCSPCFSLFGAPSPACSAGISIWQLSEVLLQ